MTLTHNFALSDEQSMILDSVRSFVDSHASVHALHSDEHQEFVAEGFTQLGTLGLFGLPVSEAGGGTGLGLLTFAVALEALAKGCGATARILLTHAGFCARSLDGLPAAAEVLGEIVAGTRLAAWVGPEHKVCAEGGKLTGNCLMVTGAAKAELFVVAAATTDGLALFVVPAAAVECSAMQALGFRACAPASVRFAGTPSGAAVATGAVAAAACARVQLVANLGGAALAIGFAQASFDAAKKHGSERIAFNKPLTAQPAVANKLVEMRRRTEAARHLVFHAARLADAGLDAVEAGMTAKLDAVDAAVFAADEAIQIHGGYGFVVEYHVERHYRDAKTLEVLDGGCESLREKLASAVS